MPTLFNNFRYYQTPGRKKKKNKTKKNRKPNALKLSSIQEKIDS